VAARGGSRSRRLPWFATGLGLPLLSLGYLLPDAGYEEALRLDRTLTEIRPVFTLPLLLNSSDLITAGAFGAASGPAATGDTALSLKVRRGDTLQEVVRPPDSSALGWQMSRSQRFDRGVLANPIGAHTEGKWARVVAAALATALAVFANCFGNLLGGWLIQRNFGRGRIIGATFVVTSLAFVGIFAAGLPDIWRYALAVFYSFVTGTVPSAALSAGMRYARSAGELGAIQGLIVNIVHAGIFVGPPLVAATVTWAGSWDAVLWPMLGCAAVALAAAFAIDRYEREARPVSVKGSTP